MNQTVFEKAFRDVVGIEGRYSDNPADGGGETMWGITEKVARAHGYSSPMRDMPVAVAHRIYGEEYWVALNLDQVAAMSPSIAGELFEQGVNMGVSRAATHFQRALNVLNRVGRDYPDIAVDGVVGPGTLRALHQLLWTRKDAGEPVLKRALNCLQGAFYIELAERREKDEAFVFGWLRNRVAL